MNPQSLAAVADMCETPSGRCGKKEGERNALLFTLKVTDMTATGNATAKTPFD